MVGYLSDPRSTSFDPRRGVKRYRIPNKQNGKASTDKKQSQQILALQRQIAAMKPKRQIRRKQSKKRNGNGKANSKLSDDPVISSVSAILRPFDTPKGLASPLTDGRPSQKFMAKAQTQVTLATGQLMAFMVCPCVANDSASLSMAICVGTAASGNFTTNATWVTTPGTVQGLTTNTPYAAAVLASGLEASNVGCGVKFTYEGTELNRGGTFRYIYDREGSYNDDGMIWSLSGATPRTLVDFINSNPNSIRQSINVGACVEMNASHEEIAYREVADASNVWFGIDGNTSGGSVGPAATPTGNIGIKPILLGYYINPSSATISFHIDLVEHWSIAGPVVQTLQTDSYAHAPMAAHVSSVLASARQAHAGTPNVHHSTVTSTTVKALKSPLGHAILNDAIAVALAR